MSDLKTNLAQLPTRLTTWVVAIVCAVAYYWLQLDPTEQQALIAAYPWLKHVAPLSALVAFVAARVWPQGPPKPPPADDLDTRPAERE